MPPITTPKVADERNSRVSRQGFLTGISRHSIPTSMAASHLGVVVDPNSPAHPCAQSADPGFFPHPEMGPQHSHSYLAYSAAVRAPSRLRPLCWVNQKRAAELFA